MRIPTIDLKSFLKEFKTNRLCYRLPYSFIMENSVILLKNGALMTTYEIELPDLESSSASSIAAMAEIMNANIMQLASEEGWGIFFDVRRKKTRQYPEGRFTNLAGWLIDQKRMKNYKDFGEHFTTNHYITFVYQLPVDAEEKATSFFLKSDYEKKTKYRKNEILLKIKNLPETKRRIEYFLEECNKVMGTLGLRIFVHHLDKSELFTYIKQSINLDDHNYIFPDETFFFLDDYLADENLQTSMPLKYGDYYCPVLYVKDFPAATYPAIFDALNRTMTEFRWTTRFLPFSKERSLKVVDEYQKRMYGARKTLDTLFMEKFLDANIDRQNQGAISLESQANELQAKITLGETLCGNYTSNVMVWDKNFNAAKDKARKLSEIIKTCGFGVAEETYNNINAWLGMMPGNVYSNLRRPIITTKNWSHVIPLSSAWQGTIKNDFLNETCGTSAPLVTCSTSYGTPFFLNLNVRDVGHTFIFGPTGAGKSTLLSLIMAQALKYPNANVICIDKQLSSRAIIMAAGGIYVEPGKDTVAFQPLSELKSPTECSDAEYTESLMWCHQFIEGLLAQQNIEVTPDMSSVINETLKLLSEKSPDMRSLTSFQQYATFTDKKTGENTIRIGLDPYCQGGQFGSIFDAEKTSLNLTKFLTIEMGSLMRLSEKAVAPALMYIFRYLEKIWNVSSTENQPITFLILDEAWLYLQHPVFSKFLQEWLRTLRKKKVFVIFATQEVAAAAKSTLNETIAQQCLTKIYLADQSATVPSLAKSYEFFGLTTSEINALSNAVMKRDYYFKNPLGTRMFTLDLDPFQLALISSNHDILNRVEEKYGRNTGKPLAFEILKETRDHYERIGKKEIAEQLDYSEFEKMLTSKIENEKTKMNQNVDAIEFYNSILKRKEESKSDENV